MVPIGFCEESCRNDMRAIRIVKTSKRAWNQLCVTPFVWNRFHLDSKAKAKATNQYKMQVRPPCPFTQSGVARPTCTRQCLLLSCIYSIKCTQTGSMDRLAWFMLLSVVTFIDRHRIGMYLCIPLRCPFFSSCNNLDNVNF
jgi:hypothetical protein